MDESEDKIFRKFDLNPDESVLISQYRCMYSKTIPIPGRLFVFNDCVCFSSLLNAKNLFFSKTRIKILMKHIVLCELLSKTFGTALSITALGASGADPGETHF